MKVYVTLEGDSGLKLYIFASPSKFSELRVCVLCRFPCVLHIALINAEYECV